MNANARLLPLTAALLVACGSAEPDSTLDQETHRVTASAQTADGDVVKHARHFQLERYDGYTVARTFGEVTSFQTTNDAEVVQDVVVLVPRGGEAPPLTGDLAGAYVVETPAATLAVNNDDMMALVTQLGLRDRLVAVGGLATYDDSVRVRVERGELGQLGYSWHLPPDMEVLLSRAPDVTFLAMDTPHNVPALARTRELGLATVPSFVWAERDVLARMEWIKFFAAFTGMENEAEQLFDEAEARYVALKSRVAAVVDTPTVMWGYHAGDDRWFMMVNNLEAVLLQDAGTHNILEDFDRPVRYDGEEFSSEGLLVAGAEAEHWILGDIHAGELPRGGYMDEFQAWRDGLLYHNYARTNDEVNAYDWYEGAVAEPDAVLADLVALFHPELLPGHELRYLGALSKEQPLR